MDPKKVEQKLIRLIEKIKNKNSQLSKIQSQLYILTRKAEILQEKLKKSESWKS